MTEQQHVDVNGVTLAYEVHGRGDTAMVFVHGYGLRSTAAMYQRLFDQLGEDFTIYALDLRGHGGSADATAPWSLPILADDVVSFAQALGLTRPVYAGHSIGGFIGLLSELRHPGAFTSLCLLATAAAIGGRLTPAEVGEFFTTSGRDSAVMHGAMQPMFVRAADENLNRAVSATVLLDETVHRAFFAPFAALSILEQLDAVSVPVLLVNGGADVVIPPDEQHRTALGIARYKEVILSAEGHMLPMEAPDATAREIRSFVLHDVPEMLASAG